MSMGRHRAIEDRALDWLIRRDEPGWSDADTAALAAWLAQSPAHQAAFWRAEHGWQAADRIGSLGAPDAQPAPVRVPPRRWRLTALAASLVCAIGIGAYALTPQFGGSARTETARYETPVGGRRTVALADGSAVQLNTRTVVRAMVSGGRRDVWLDDGEAYFEVAHRDGDPFVVHAGKQTITVLGTKFSVRRERDRVTVNVLEGRVRVDDGQGVAARAAIITAGDTAVSRGPSTLIAPKSKDRVEGALAWRDGMLSFDLMPLAEVAAEFNRYNRLQIVVADPALEHIPIGGTFQATNVEAFVRLLHDVYGLNVVRTGDRVEISS